HVVRSCELMRHKKLEREDWEVYFAKRLSVMQYPIGLVVRHPEGYLRYDTCIENRGVSKLIFRPIGTNTMPTQVLYRGTRCLPTDKMRVIFDTFHEDFTKELGARGIISSYE